MVRRTGSIRASQRRRVSRKFRRGRSLRKRRGSTRRRNTSYRRSRVRRRTQRRKRTRARTHKRTHKRTHIGGAEGGTHMHGILWTAIRADEEAGIARGGGDTSMAITGTTNHSVRISDMRRKAIAAGTIKGGKPGDWMSCDLGTNHGPNIRCKSNQSLVEKPKKGCLDGFLCGGRPKPNRL